jgi:hypothetical protein
LIFLSCLIQTFYWCRWRDSDKNKQFFQNPLLSHYPPTTQKEPLHYSRTPTESGILEHLSNTRHYPSITNQLPINYSLITRSLALPLALFLGTKQMLVFRNRYLRKCSVIDNIAAELSFARQHNLNFIRVDLLPLTGRTVLIQCQLLW